jgi:hypothetical protein
VLAHRFRLPTSIIIAAFLFAGATILWLLTSATAKAVPPTIGQTAAGSTSVPNTTTAFGQAAKSVAEPSIGGTQVRHIAWVPTSATTRTASTATKSSTRATQTVTAAARSGMQPVIKVATAGATTRAATNTVSSSASKTAGTAGHTFISATKKTVTRRQRRQRRWRAPRLRRQ